MRGLSWNGNPAHQEIMLSEPWTWDRPHPDDEGKTHFEYIVSLAEELGAGLEIWPWNFAGVRTGATPENKIASFSRELMEEALDRRPHSTIRVFGQKDTKPDTFPWGRLEEGNPHFLRVNKAAGSNPHHAYSLALDPWEFLRNPEIGPFFEWARSVDPHGDTRLWGVRMHPSEPAPGPGNLACHGGFLPVETVEALSAGLTAMLAWANPHGVPVRADDRFRFDRPDPDEKDFSKMLHLARLVALAVKLNIGTSIGILLGPNTAMAHARGMRRPPEHLMPAFIDAFQGVLPGGEEPPPDNGDNDDPGDAGVQLPNANLDHFADHIEKAVRAGVAGNDRALRFNARKGVWRNAWGIGELITDRFEGDQ